jgi:ABC-type polysaccharide/polyol phosphate export permease
VFLPIAVLNQLVFLYGASLMLATLTVRFRDIQFLVQNLLLFWFFLTPVAYPLSVVPERYRLLVDANPATVLVRPFQEIFFESRIPGAALLLAGTLLAFTSLLLAASHFEARRDSLVEEI